MNFENKFFCYEHDVHIYFEQVQFRQCGGVILRNSHSVGLLFTEYTDDIEII